MQPSIQKLVSNCASECLAHLSDEAVHSEAYREDIPGALAALDDLEGAFSDSLIDDALLKEALEKMEARFTAETRKHERNVRYSLAWTFCTLSHSFVVGVGPRSRLKTIHACSSSTVFGVAYLFMSE
jgi:proteasome activator subunit 4